MLCADRQFLNHELEVIIAGQGNNRTIRIGRANPKCSWQCPAQWACLTAIDPVARAINMQELRAGNLAQTNGRNIASVTAKCLVHFLINTLRLQWCLIEMRFA